MYYNGKKKMLPDFIEALHTDSFLADELTQYNKPTS